MRTLLLCQGSDINEERETNTKNKRKKERNYEKVDRNFIVHGYGDDAACRLFRRR